MYPLELFILVAVVDIIITVYAIVMRGPNYFKVMGAWILATFITVYLALSIISGSAFIYSSTTLQTSVVQDDGLMWILIIIAVAQALLGLMEIIESYEEYQMNKSDTTEHLIT